MEKEQGEVMMQRFLLLTEAQAQLMAAEAVRVFVRKNGSLAILAQSNVMDPMSWGRLLAAVLRGVSEGMAESYRQQKEHFPEEVKKSGILASPGLVGEEVIKLIYDSFVEEMKNPTDYPIVENNRFV